MRRRRNLIVALLLVVAMVVGVGYAALAEELIIEGSAQLAHSADENVLDVVFTTAEVTGATGQGVDGVVLTDVADVSTGDGKVASYDIKELVYQGDQVVLEYTIENQSDAYAILNEIASFDGTCAIGTGAGTTVNTDQYFERTVEIKYGNEAVYKNLDTLATGTANSSDDGHVHDLTGLADKIYLEPNDTATDGRNELDVRITVTLIKTVGIDADGADSRVTLSGSDVFFDFTGDDTAP